jgi:hypothetical protein
MGMTAGLPKAMLPEGPSQAPQRSSPPAARVDSPEPQDAADIMEEGPGVWPCVDVVQWGMLAKSISILGLCVCDAWT